ncbi:MAG: aminotransferase class I/II-fold pyridoxal phosphate-dependent enzyme [Acidobacteria bacterium]|nr:aminotransferase class I/II-fold pyridoxal phosphate-dependent enzyme [Acidobacteriota bacterium]
MVHYGPPAAALDAARDALADPVTHEYQNGAGIEPLIAALGAKLQAENGLDVARGSRVMVTAGANMAFMHAVFAVTEPGDEIILPGGGSSIPTCAQDPRETPESNLRFLGSLGRAGTNRVWIGTTPINLDVNVFWCSDKSSFNFGAVKGVPQLECVDQ